MASQLAVPRMKPLGNGANRKMLTNRNGNTKNLWPFLHMVFLNSSTDSCQISLYQARVTLYPLVITQNDMVVDAQGLGVPKATEEAAHLFAIDLS